MDHAKQFRKAAALANRGRQRQGWRYSVNGHQKGRHSGHFARFFRSSRLAYTLMPA